MSNEDIKSVIKELRSIAELMDAALEDEAADKIDELMLSLEERIYNDSSDSKPRYENGCTGDPVLVPGSFRTERNKP